jgi:hypothetical protein
MRWHVASKLYAGATMEAVPYKGFFFVVTVRRAVSTKETFDIVNEIYRNLSESDAYAFGVKEARAWIDEQD